MYARAIATLTAASLLLAPMTAMAQYGQVQVQVQGQYQPQQPVYVQQQQQTPPPPPNAQAGDGQYVAPMQQQTQQTYIPQSVAMSGPRVIRDWHEGEPIPPGYHPSTRIRGGLVGGGVGLFGAMYLISVLVAAGGADSQCCNALYVPIVGPFIQMGNLRSGDASLNAVGGVFLALDGIAQAAGVAMFIFGVAVPKTVLVRNDLGVLKNVHVAPIVGNVTGLALGAQF